MRKLECSLYLGKRRELWLFIRKLTHVIRISNSNDLSPFVYQAAKQEIPAFLRLFYRNIRPDWQIQIDDMACQIIEIDRVRSVERLEFFCNLNKKERDMTNFLYMLVTGLNIRLESRQKVL